MEANLVPAPDPAGLPGPPWLFHVLLVLTFFLHMLFMNLTLGGTLLAWLSHVRAGGRSEGPHGALTRRLMSVNTYAISLAITTGVAPLLFIQLLYQRFFYSGTILLGWIWFSFLIFLTAGYYAVYVYKHRGAPARGSGGGASLGIAAICFLLIAMIHVAVHLVHVQPDRWPRFAESPWSVLADPTYFPRLLHFVLASMAFSALLMAWWSVRRARSAPDPAVEAAIARSCWKWALWTTLLQVLDGLLLLFALPQDVLLGLVRGGVATLGPLALAILLGVGLLMLLGRPIDPAARPGLVTGTLAAMAATVAVMSITRHQVRVLYLDPIASLSRAQAAPQWGNTLLFAVFLIASLATVACMIRRVLSEPASGDQAA